MSDIHPFGHLLVYAPETSSRLEYIFDEVLGRRLGLAWKITENIDYFNRSGSFKLNYSNEIIDGCVNIPMHALLFQDDIRSQTIQTCQDPVFGTIFFSMVFDDLPFLEKETIQIPFDLFAASFYLLSRYEEYLPHTHDRHGRYPHTASLAFRQGFILQPLVDTWSRIMGTYLQKLQPEIPIQTSSYQSIQTIDIDFLYKYKGHSRFKLFLKWISFWLQGNHAGKKQCMQFLRNAIPDPYDSYALLSRSQHRQVYFWLLSNQQHAHDGNHASHHPLYLETIRSLPSHAEHGLHPSYASSFRHQELKHEIKRFESLFHRSPQLVRAHFLKIQMPYTYHRYEQEQLLSDWSMQYAGHAGFRASTCKPFSFYCLHREQKTTLEMVPGCYMDVTLKNEMQLSTDQATELLKQLEMVCKQEGGIFTGIWHNSSFDETQGWKGWDSVFMQIQNTFIPQ